MATKIIPVKVMKTMTKGYCEILLPRDGWSCDMDCQSCQHNPCPHFDKGCERAMMECYEDVRRGDVVAVEPAKGYETKYARLAYLMVPLFFALGCLFGGVVMDYDLANTLVMGAIMAVLNLVLAWLMNRQARMRRVIDWRMVEMLRATERLIHKKKK